MVDVAQLVEPRIVIPAVVGSSPIVHPIFWEHQGRRQPGRIVRRGTRHRGSAGRLGPGHQARKGPEKVRCGLLAQLVEQLTLNQLVIGSSPIRPTTFSPSTFS